MQYRLTDMVAWLRELTDRLSADESLDTEGQDLQGLFLREAAARFPKATREDMLEAITVYRFEVQQEREDEQLELQRQEEELEAITAFYNKHSITLDTPWNEAVLAVAQKGDPEAKELLRQMNSQEALVESALLGAAVDAHPAWNRDGRYFTFNPEIGGPEDGHSLIDWYQRNHPHEAAAITDRILSAA